MIYDRWSSLSLSLDFRHRSGHSLDLNRKIFVENTRLHSCVETIILIDIDPFLLHDCFYFYVLFFVDFFVLFHLIWTCFFLSISLWCVSILLFPFLFAISDHHRVFIHIYGIFLFHSATSWSSIQFLRHLWWLSLSLASFDRKRTRQKWLVSWICSLTVNTWNSSASCIFHLTKTFLTNEINWPRRPDSKRLMCCMSKSNSTCSVSFALPPWNGMN